MDRLKFRINSRGIARVSFTAPRDHNTLEMDMADRLREAFEEAGHNKDVRLLILDAEGPSFCAGLGQSWFKSMLDMPFAESVADASRLMNLYEAIDHCPKPVIAKVQGSAFGAGLGLLACADTVIADSSATFCCSEVRLGMAPALMAPFLLSKIGPSYARRLFLTAEVFTAASAKQFGLVHDVLTGPEALEEQTRKVTTAILKGGTEAQRLAKLMIHEANPYNSEDLARFLTQVQAHRRVSVEGREGLSAFINKRTPNWVPPEDKE